MFFFSFDVKFLFKFFSLPSKPAFFTILAIPLLVDKFPSANLAVKCSVVNLSNSGVVI